MSKNDKTSTEVKTQGADMDSRKEKPAQTGSKGESSQKKSSKPEIKQADFARFFQGSQNESTDNKTTHMDRGDVIDFQIAFENYKDNVNIFFYPITYDDFKRPEMEEVLKLAAFFRFTLYTKGVDTESTGIVDLYLSSIPDAAAAKEKLKKFRVGKDKKMKLTIEMGEPGHKYRSLVLACHNKTFQNRLDVSGNHFLPFVPHIDTSTRDYCERVACIDKLPSTFNEETLLKCFPEVPKFLIPQDEKGNTFGHVYAEYDSFEAKQASMKSHLRAQTKVDGRIAYLDYLKNYEGLKRYGSRRPPPWGMPPPTGPHHGPPGAPMGPPGHSMGPPPGPSPGPTWGGHHPGPVTGPGWPPGPPPTPSWPSEPPRDWPPPSDRSRPLSPPLRRLSPGDRKRSSSRSRRSRSLERRRSPIPRLHKSRSPRRHRSPLPKHERTRSPRLGRSHSPRHHPRPSRSPPRHRSDGSSHRPRVDLPHSRRSRSPLSSRRVSRSPLSSHKLSRSPLSSRRPLSPVTRDPYAIPYGSRALSPPPRRRRSLSPGPLRRSGSPLPYRQAPSPLPRRRSPSPLPPRRLASPRPSSSYESRPIDDLPPMSSYSPTRPSGAGLRRSPSPVPYYRRAGSSPPQRTGEDYVRRSFPEEDKQDLDSAVDFAQVREIMKNFPEQTRNDADGRQSSGGWADDQGIARQQNPPPRPRVRPFPDPAGYSSRPDTSSIGDQIYDKYSSPMSTNERQPHAGGGDRFVNKSTPMSYRTQASLNTQTHVLTSSSVDRINQTLQKQSPSSVPIQGILKNVNQQLQKQPSKGLNDKQYPFSNFGPPQGQKFDDRSQGPGMSSSSNFGSQNNPSKDAWGNSLNKETFELNRPGNMNVGGSFNSTGSQNLPGNQFQKDFNGNRNLQNSSVLVSSSSMQMPLKMGNQNNQSFGQGPNFSQSFQSSPRFQTPLSSGSGSLPNFGMNRGPNFSSGGNSMTGPSPMVSTNRGPPQNQMGPPSPQFQSNMGNPNPNFNNSVFLGGSGGQGNMGQGNIGPGNMGQGNIGQGIISQGNMGQSNMGQGNMGQMGNPNQGFGGMPGNSNFNSRLQGPNNQGNMGMPPPSFGGFNQGMRPF